jgi:glycosyltransferase involved in cell wall biosynthesis
MLNNKSIAVVVPCYNEEKQIGGVLASMPDFVDLIIVVNDKSKDGTAAKVKEFIANDRKTVRRFEKRVKTYSDSIYASADNIALDLEKEAEKFFIPCEVAAGEHSNVVMLTHSRNGGKGAGVATGYKYAKDHGIDVTAIMDGDGQMNPAELEMVCMPVVTGKADYSKGNRFKHRTAHKYIPKVRFYGNSILSILTKIATGYWRVSDSQTGFTAISLEALENIELHNLYPSYGVYNDILQKLNLANFTVTEVPITPVYHIGEKSKMKIFKVVPTIAWLLVRRFIERLFGKYLFAGFHPLFLLYAMSFLSFVIDIPIIVRFVHAFVATHTIWSAHLTVLTSLLIFSFQSLVFAMWFDMHDNERLYV